MTGGKNKIFLVILATGLICSSVYSQEQINPSGDWDMRLIPYFWAPSLDAESNVNGLSGNVDLSFGDVLDYLNFTAMGRMEAWKNKWGLTFDSLYMFLGTRESFQVRRGLVDFILDADVRLGMVDFGLAYRFLRNLLVIITSRSSLLSRIAALGICILDRKLI